MRAGVYIRFRGDYSKCADKVTHHHQSTVPRPPAYANTQKLLCIRFIINYWISIEHSTRAITIHTPLGCARERTHARTQARTHMRRHPKTLTHQHSQHTLRTVCVCASVCVGA